MNLDKRKFNYTGSGEVDLSGSIGEKYWSSFGLIELQGEIPEKFWTGSGVVVIQGKAKVNQADPYYVATLRFLPKDAGFTLKGEPLVVEDVYYSNKKGTYKAFNYIDDKYYNDCNILDPTNLGEYLELNSQKSIDQYVRNLDYLNSLNPVDTDRSYIQSLKYSPEGIAYNSKGEQVLIKSVFSLNGKEYATFSSPKENSSSFQSEIKSCLSNFAHYLYDDCCLTNKNSSANDIVIANYQKALSDLNSFEYSTLPISEMVYSYEVSSRLNDLNSSILNKITSYKNKLIELNSIQTFNQDSSYIYQYGDKSLSSYDSASLNSYKKALDDLNGLSLSNRSESDYNVYLLPENKIIPVRKGKDLDYLNKQLKLLS